MTCLTQEIGTYCLTASIECITLYFITHQTPTFVKQQSLLIALNYTNDLILCNNLPNFYESVCLPSNFDIISMIYIYIYKESEFIIITYRWISATEIEKKLDIFRMYLYSFKII